MKDGKLSYEFLLELHLVDEVIDLARELRVRLELPVNPLHETRFLRHRSTSGPAGASRPRA